MLGVETPELVARKKTARLVALAAAILLATAEIYFLYSIGADVRALSGDLAWVIVAPWVALGTGYVGYAAYLAQLARAVFWRQFAAERGWTYMSRGDPAKEKALMFRSGNRRWIKDVVSGVHEGYPMRMFEYTFLKQEGKTSTPYFYTVFAFAFKGTFPHLYLNYLNDNWKTYTNGVQVPMPAEFESKFHLYAPEQYEIEALQIFSPDILERLLDTGWKFDIELIEQEAVIFIPGIVQTQLGLDDAFNHATTLLKIIAPSLDRVRFSQIGSHTPTLARTWKS